MQANAPTAQVDDLTLIALPTAVNCADLFVRFTLGEWRLRNMVGECSAVACALVEAAIEAADPKTSRLITLRLRLTGDYLVVELEAARFVMPPTSPDLRTGELQLSGGVKLIWCEIPLPTGVNATAVPLPRRERRRSPAAEALGDEPEVDPELIQRILFGLGGPGGSAPR
ncbi:ATP-binding protein [Lentzea sp. NPDC042327]|uniref:ATP-binding protein n=1 Tax=Lentzea sp. NPDC042327 TaxID=3154801 RepID=UPI00340B7EA9